MQFGALLIDSFREALDRKIFWVLIGIAVVVAAAMFCVEFRSDQVIFLFGLHTTPNTNWDPATEAGRKGIVDIGVSVMDLILGWVGTTLMVIAAAGAFPAMMEKGAIEVVLGKPIGRVRLFFYKYLASMTLVALVSVVFVGLTFVVMGVRWKVWMWPYLLSVPLSLLMFSYIYCVTVLVAVKTKSALASVLLSLVAWFVFWAFGYLGAQFSANPSLERFEKWRAPIVAASWVPPKTLHVTYFAQRWCGGSKAEDVLKMADLPEFKSADMGDAGNMVRDTLLVEAHLMRTDPVSSIASSLIFEAAVLLLAAWSFRRQDF